MKLTDLRFNLSFPDLKPLKKAKNIDRESNYCICKNSDVIPIMRIYYDLENDYTETEKQAIN